MRLSAEQLGARIVPAAFWWQPTTSTIVVTTNTATVGEGPPASPPTPPPPAPTSDLLATTAANWLQGPGIPHARWDRAPGGSDDLYIHGTADGNFDCYVPMGVTTVVPPPGGTSPATPTANTFAGIHTLSGYTKAVVLQKSVAVGVLDMNFGVIRQDDPATNGYAGNLWVTGNLLWTGGTLNDNTVAGTIYLAGATGLAAPASGPVNLGSTLDLVANGGGSTLSVLKGTYNLLGGDGFVVRALCQTVIKPDPTLDAPVTMDATTLSNVKDSLIRLEAGGTVTFKPANRPAGNTTLAKFDAKGNKATIANIGGVVSIEDRTEVKLAGKIKIDDDPVRQSFFQRGGTTKIEAGSRVVAEFGTYVDAGGVQILPLLDKSTGLPVAEADQPNAYLGGKQGLFTFELRGTGKVSMPALAASNNCYLKLEIDGNWYWADGVVSLALYPSNMNRSDKVIVKGEVTVVNAPKLEMRWPGFETEMRAVPQLTPWVLVTTDDGITNDVTRTYGDPQTQVTMNVSRVAQNKKLQAQKSN